MSIQLTPSPIIPSYPFLVHISKNYEGSKLVYEGAVHYNSKLYRPLTQDNKYLKYSRVSITGLDLIKKLSEDEIKKDGAHCILEIKISTLSPKSAEIKWITTKLNDQNASPIEFNSKEERDQIIARVMIASVLYDKYQIPGVTSETDSPGIYVYQYIQSNLILANMIFNGVPVVYPVPFAGSPDIE
jgi:hypothetical protein